MTTVTMIPHFIFLSVVLFIAVSSFIGESICVSLSIARTLAQSLHPLTILSVRGAAIIRAHYHSPIWFHDEDWQWKRRPTESRNY